MKILWPGLLQDIFHCIDIQNKNFMAWVIGQDIFHCTEIQNENSKACIVGQDIFHCKGKY
jgi:hypothetical protein